MARSVIEPTLPLEAGQTVDLVYPNGNWIGRGIYNPHSRIRIRLYQWQRDEALSTEWLRRQLDDAWQLRASRMDRDSELDALRIVNSEGDGLSGLIIDRFLNHFVVQITSMAMMQWSEEIQSWLLERFQPQGILLRVERAIAGEEGIDQRLDWLHGQPPADPIEFREHDVRLQVCLQDSQKTGYYLDQRANRRNVADWIGAGPLLDVCCYQGGFSLAACRWGNPTEVVAVDSSARALEQAAENAANNQVSNIRFVEQDCFRYLEELEKSDQKFRSIILDPPKMASHRKQIPAALRAYHRLNLSAVQALEPGGILVTCSCSGRISQHDFVGVLGAVSKRTSRPIQILRATGADFDHPVSANCPESNYLKCLICRVGRAR